MTALVVWADGEMIDAAAPAVAATDLGFVFGKGLFETLQVRDGHVLAEQLHRERLLWSAAALGFPAVDGTKIDDGIATVLEVSRAERARLRYTVTASSRVVVTISALPSRLRHSRVVTASWPRNERSPLASHKTVSYFECMLALEQASAVGADEALFRNTAGDYCEGATSNLFVVKDGRLLTPPIEAGLLPGVTRGLLMEQADATGLDVLETTLSPSAVQSADELFLTSSLKDILPIQSLDGEPRRIGDVTLSLQKVFRQPVG